MVDARSVWPIQDCTVLRSTPPCKAWVAKLALNLWSQQESGSIPARLATPLSVLSMCLSGTTLRGREDQIGYLAPTGLAPSNSAAKAAGMGTVRSL